MPTLLADDIEHLRGRLTEFAAEGCQLYASKDMWAHRINSLCDLALKGLSQSSPAGAVDAIRAAKEFFSQHNACPVGMDAVLERIAFAQSESTEWLIWSNEHRAWWGHDRCGYRETFENAGRYTFSEARRICRSRHWADGRTPPETMIHIDEVLYAG